jgi:hypothetical protein
MLDRSVAVADNALAHTSSWANALTGQDLHARREEIVPSPVVATPDDAQLPAPRASLPA